MSEKFNHGSILLFYLVDFKIFSKNTISLLVSSIGYGGRKLIVKGARTLAGRSLANATKREVQAVVGAGTMTSFAVKEGGDLKTSWSKLKHSQRAYDVVEKQCWQKAKNSKMKATCVERLKELNAQAKSFDSQMSDSMSGIMIGAGASAFPLWSKILGNAKNESK